MSPSSSLAFCAAFELNLYKVTKPPVPAHASRLPVTVMAVILNIFSNLSMDVSVLRRSKSLWVLNLCRMFRPRPFESQSFTEPSS